MAELNHFAISAALGSIVGPAVTVHHGQFGSSELAATMSVLLERRKEYVQALEVSDDLTRSYERAITQAYKQVRQGYSSDRVLADPTINREFIRACRDLGLDDTPFHLNIALIGLRKHNKLKLKSKRSTVRDQWQYAVASEVGARVMFYKYGASVDTTLAHPKLVKEFDDLASSITPGFDSFEYRWAALNMRKKGANVHLTASQIDRLDWSENLAFDVPSLPEEHGVYTLFEKESCLFVGATPDINQSVQSHKRIAQVRLFQPELWRPSPDILRWRYAAIPRSDSDYRFGVVRALVGRWHPVFNIPRGSKRAA